MFSVARLRAMRATGHRRQFQSRHQRQACTNTSTAGRSALLDGRAALERVLPQLHTLVLDLDGVLWRGSEVVPQAEAALEVFRALGKRLLFVTNNSSKSRAGCVSKFHTLGLQVEASEVVTSGFAAAAYCAETLPAGKQVLVLGTAGVTEELAAAGVPFRTHVPCLRDTDAMARLQLPADIGAVLVGWDPDFSYSKLAYATMVLRELGCPLVATNCDAADNIGGGRMMAGTGGLVAAVEVASGRQAVNVGKGGDWLLPFLSRRFDLQPGRAAVVGDRLDTDIALGKAGGFVTVLTLTGVATLAEAEAAAPSAKPDYVVSSIATLAGLSR